MEISWTGKVTREAESRVSSYFALPPYGNNGYMSKAEYILPGKTRVRTACPPLSFGRGGEGAELAASYLLAPGSCLPTPAVFKPGFTMNMRIESPLYRATDLECGGSTPLWIGSEFRRQTATPESPNRRPSRSSLSAF